MSGQVLSPALSEPEEWTYRWPLHAENEPCSDRELGVMYADAHRDALVHAGRLPVGGAEWSREFVPGIGLCLVATTQTCRILTGSAADRRAA